MPIDLAELAIGDNVAFLINDILYQITKNGENSFTVDMFNECGNEGVTDFDTELDEDDYLIVKSTSLCSTLTPSDELSAGTTILSELTSGYTFAVGEIKNTILWYEAQFALDY